MASSLERARPVEAALQGLPVSPVSSRCAPLAWKAYAVALFCASGPFYVHGIAALTGPSLENDLLVPISLLLVAGNLCVLELPPYRVLHLVTGIILFGGFFIIGPAVLGLLVLSIPVSELLVRGLPRLFRTTRRFGVEPIEYVIPALAVGLVLGGIHAMRSTLGVSYPLVAAHASASGWFFLVLLAIYGAFILLTEVGVGLRFGWHEPFEPGVRRRDALVYLLAILLGAPMIWGIVRVHRADLAGTLFACGWMLWSFGAFAVAAGLVRRQLEIERLIGTVAAQERLASLGRLASVIAHQTRHHLGILNMSGYVLAETLAKEPLSAKAREAVDRELQAVARTREELDKLLAQGLRNDSHEERFGLVALARECTEDLALLAAACQVSIVCRGREHAVRGDRLRLKQAITNVLRNAVEAAPPGTEVTVELAGERSGLCLRIRDRGPGLSPSAQKRLFEPLFSEKPDGLGMGLYVAREIVTAHGGALTLGNADEGARAEIRLRRDRGGVVAPGLSRSARRAE